MISLLAPIFQLATDRLALMLRPNSGLGGCYGLDGLASKTGSHRVPVGPSIYPSRLKFLKCIYVRLYCRRRIG